MTMWPLWECLSNESLLFLVKYQWDVYGTRLDILIAEERSVNVEAVYPSLDQIDKTMREKPLHVKRGKGW